MKTLLTLSLSIIGFLGLGSMKADAQIGHRNAGNVFVSSYLSCGTPVYSQRVFLGYDRWGQPIWQTQRVHNFRQRGVINRPISRRGYNRPVRRSVHRAYRGRFDNRRGFRSRSYYRDRRFRR